MKLSIGRVCVIVLLAGMLTGCAGGGKLAVRSSLEPRTEIAGNFTTGVYALDDKNNLDVLLIEGDPASPTQAVHVRMYWRPRAGRTPIDERSTNATINYIIFNGDAAGVYSGAGFLFPNNKPGGGTFRASVRDTSVRLLDASEKFDDKLGIAVATGSLTAKRDDVATHDLLRKIQILLRQKLGYPRFVMK
ncbi:MAG: hypothetical protein GC162_03260 [Planctomycetes bacterium]|nr:hypothetical protein [Planctomycetota bacterium]